MGIRLIQQFTGTAKSLWINLLLDKIVVSIFISLTLGKLLATRSEITS